MFSALRDHINISPGGIVFLKSSLQRGILPQMLEEILNTRIMVKQSMKKHAKVSRTFNIKQLYDLRR
jgi:DNA polymerase zeta